MWRAPAGTLGSGGSASRALPRAAAARPPDCCGCLLEHVSDFRNRRSFNGGHVLVQSGGDQHAQLANLLTLSAAHTASAYPPARRTARARNISQLLVATVGCLADERDQLSNVRAKACAEIGPVRVGVFEHVIQRRGGNDVVGTIASLECQGHLKRMQEERRALRLAAGLGGVLGRTRSRPGQGRSSTNPKSAPRSGPAAYECDPRAAACPNHLVRSVSRLGGRGWVPVILPLEHGMMWSAAGGSRPAAVPGQGETAVLGDCDALSVSRNSPITTNTGARR